MLESSLVKSERRQKPKPFPRFRPPALFEEGTVRKMWRLAGKGFESRFKRETYGFLFGTVARGRRLILRRACYYRGGLKTRTGVVFRDWPTIMRVAHRRQKLAREMMLRFAGAFHSHVEIAGEVFRGLSDEDRESFRFDPMSLLEVVVSVWVGTNHYPERSSRTIACFDPKSGYHYRIKVYAKLKNGIRQVSAKVMSSHIVVVF